MGFGQPQRSHCLPPAPQSKNHTTAGMIAPALFEQGRVGWVWDGYEGGREGPSDDHSRRSLQVQLPCPYTAHHPKSPKPAGHPARCPIRSTKQQPTAQRARRARPARSGPPAASSAKRGELVTLHAPRTQSPLFRANATLKGGGKVQQGRTACRGLLGSDLTATNGPRPTIRWWFEMNGTLASAPPLFGWGLAPGWLGPNSCT